ncbi:MAG: Lrp/AsnC family transcriptional regulator [Methanomicrobium sp.]|jgi:Lrp/AsnC family transcriptional regulator for asnA, asnC and gidA/Lrp/AsnC family leucine-responsive transcriptional regulator|uniref:Lrp/AsnC family transcriptional regulator n=1 Tax=Methanomicrobium mobile TaxID=2205 RepID=UPI0005B27B7F|nr:Lrp/AsnC family transcriptional regulator [Methanomicrobium mobile]MBO4522142.1 Lrp/AsnC family transcriptional regulator [Methanomicrobium sp.]MBP5082657.1 Lrp/AsnC family transcriptional regulator [Methanomicrobium sp.]MBP5474981.1 Lrp/AsnC family transcriptional regulator [Methanomicrobium sp.]MBR6010982.1 Lrp/AsnC family transcriptional regulator [Methanomicrobium sp.]MBR6447706.1 Lrp/AsnC family transcriptional regulator [Methanomicrobium sp.]
MLDKVDNAILNELAKDGRTSMADLGKKLDIAPSTVFKRIEKLRSTGIIQRFTIVVNPEFFKNSIIVFLSISVDPLQKPEIEKFLLKMDHILEVYETLEPDDFLAKARVHEIAQLKTGILIPLSELSGVRDIKPILTVKKVKEQFWNTEEYDLNGN